MPPCLWWCGSLDYSDAGSTGCTVKLMATGTEKNGTIRILLYSLAAVIQRVSLVVLFYCSAQQILRGPYLPMGSFSTV